jgi:hypothetical protein
MARARRSNSDLTRAARNLILAHGARASGVAEIRAQRLDECGADEVAQTWREIGACVRAIETGMDPCARNAAASSQQDGLAPSAIAVPDIRNAPGPIRPHAGVNHAPEVPGREYKAGDIIHGTSDLEHWVGGKPKEFARSIGSAASK